jgi:hypothetical protein
MRRLPRFALLAPVLLVAACSTLPTGPDVLVLPGTGKSFEQFRGDESECRQYASTQVGGKTANETATDNTVRNAAVGAAVGTVAGALIGGRDGAGAGAGAGLIVGTAAGAGSGELSGRSLQRRYDFSYQQCMYAKGHRVPVSGRWESGVRPAPAAAPAPVPPSATPSHIPPPNAPPPPGAPPPGRTG